MFGVYQHREMLNVIGIATAADADAAPNKFIHHIRIV